MWCMCIPSCLCSCDPYLIEFEMSSDCLLLTHLYCAAMNKSFEAAS